MARELNFSERADQCALHAATAQNERAREVWAKMEQYWRKRAGAKVPLVPDQPTTRDRERVR
jgi:hypothetical protein